ncbi:MAG: hypothetical protein BMS9Abin36_1216 [Gammaproteobacteria bacterium]|nr:MAG: hypothetical protein BMS9Abin36_1216 [Gammaproteobacteria bacterium]
MNKIKIAIIGVGGRLGIFNTRFPVLRDGQ